MTAAIRFEVAQEKVAGLPDERLVELRDLDEVWDLARRVGVQYSKLKKLIRMEQLKRGLLKPTDLKPDERRELVDPNNLDLKAIASGPIMDIANIYLPAGKLSMAETKQREMSQILGAEGIEAQRVETRSKAPREARKPGAKHPPKLSGGQTNA